MNGRDEKLDIDALCPELEAVVGLPVQGMSVLNPAIVLIVAIAIFSES